MGKTLLTIAKRAVVTAAAFLLISAPMNGFSAAGVETDREAISESADVIVTSWDLDDAGMILVGNEEYGQGEMDLMQGICLEEFLAGASGYESMLGLDTSRPLDEQKCTISDEDITWNDYFSGRAKEMLTMVSALYQEALSAEDDEGASLISEGEEYAESVMESYQAIAGDAEYDSLDAYLKARYSDEVTENLFRRMVIQSRVGDIYSQKVMDSAMFTREELEEYYEAHPQQFRAYTYLFAFVQASGYGEVDSEKCAEMLAGIQQAASFEKEVLQLTGREAVRLEGITLEELGNPQAGDVMWVTDPSRKEGDTYVGESGDDLFVLFWLSSDDGGYASGSGEWENTALTLMREERFKEWQEEILKKYG